MADTDDVRWPYRGVFMLDHISITVTSIDRVRGFYDAVMGALAVPKIYDRADALGYGVRASANQPDLSYFSVFASPSMQPDRRHWCFKAPDRAAVVAFHVAGLLNGGQCDGPPGLRAQYHPSYFAAFLQDPDGNRIEAVCHRPEA